MNPVILVTWATRMGSTQDVAETIAEVLRESGETVELLPVTAVRSLEPYAAIVLGSALYMGRFHRHVRRFLKQYQAALPQIPAALFVLGPVQSDPKEWQGAEEQLRQELARIPWFSPVSRQLFGGCWDPARMPFPFSWTLRRTPARDARDWEAIRAWARSLHLLGQPALH